MKVHGRSSLRIGLAALTALGLLLFRLGTLPGGISPQEAVTAHMSQSLSAIVHQPQYLPLTLLHWLFGLAPIHTVFWFRLPNVLLGAATLVTTTFIIRRWYGLRMAIFGFIMLVCSAWFLHAARLASFDILYLWAIPTLLASHLLLYDYADSKRVFFLWLFAQIALLYVPGMIWFVLLNLWWQREELGEAWRSLDDWLTRLGLLVFGVVLCVPLILCFLFSPSLQTGLLFLGLPQTMPAVLDLGKRAANSLLYIGVRAHGSPDSWLNSLPVLDAFLTVMLLAGLYFYGQHWRAARTRLIASFTVLGLLLFIAGGAVSYSIIVPVLYLLAAAGIAYLLHRWLKVFPRNPLARGTGILLISVAVALSCWYGIRQYFIAWPHHPATSAAFDQRPVPRSHLIQ